MGRLLEVGVPFLGHSYTHLVEHDTSCAQPGPVSKRACFHGPKGMGITTKPRSTRSTRKGTPTVMLEPMWFRRVDLEVVETAWALFRSLFGLVFM